MIEAARPHDERVAELIAAFQREFGRPAAGIAQAPGRVNLIGEHVDYNDGLVLPFAIDRSALVAWRSREPADDDRGLGLYSVNYGGRGDVSHRRSADARYERRARSDDWAAYPRGVHTTLAEAGHPLRAGDLALAGDVPQGAGLSSSAALEVAVAGAFRDAFSLPISDVELALLCQRAENEYVGVQCGIMDQFASTLSKRGHALLIDCRSLEYEHIPLRLEEYGLAVAIVNSGVKRELASSAYNERRRECEEAVALLGERLGRPELASLRDVSAEEMASVTADRVALRRARHVVSEIARVREAVAALRRDDFAALGALMRASHKSLRDDYDVSSPELDLLVELASAQSYVLGSRLTGAGFGGCTVSLVQTGAAEAFDRDVVEAYAARTGRPAVTYVTTPQDGLRTWRL